MRSNLAERLIRVGNRWLAPVLLVFGLAGSIRAGIAIVSLPGDFSFTRLLLSSIPAAIGLICVGLFFYLTRNSFSRLEHLNERLAESKKISKIEFALPVLWFLFYLLAFLPIAEGSWKAIYIRLLPVFQVFFLTTSEAWLYWLFITRQNVLHEHEENKQSIAAGLTAGAVILLLILIIAVTGMGIGAGTQFWGKAGVPILHWQLWIAGGFAVAWLLVQKLGWKVTGFFQNDGAVIFLLWIISFALWQNIPLAASRYSTELYPPNYVSYPYSDAGDYAIQAEAILVGKGFPYGFIDKPLHLVFLSLLGLLAGKDFALQTTLQVAVLALIPSLMYLLASKMTSRSAGIFAGITAMFMQANNLVLTNRIQMTNVKMTMSESLTCLMLLLVALTLFYWWTDQKTRWVYPALAGAVLGLSSLVRLNVIVIAPFVFLTWLIVSGIRLRGTWKSALIFLVFCILPLIPWSIRTQIVLHNPIEFVKSKTEGVLLRQRYEPLINKTEEPSNEPTDQAINDDQIPSGKAGIKGLAVPMLQSGFHNLVSVALVLPASTTHTGLEDTIRLPYWDQEWNGKFSPGGMIVLTLSLLIVVFGFAAVWKVKQAAALIPLLVLFPYLLANTASLVSGGRYVVPVDWVLPLYYSFGMTALFIWFLKIPTITTNNQVHSKRFILNSIITKRIPLICLGLVFLISLIPMILSLGIPNRYTAVKPGQILAEMKKMDLQLPNNLTLDELDKFTEVKDASFNSGRAMFPRWMKTGEGDTGGAGSAFSALPFDHLSFSILSDSVYPFDVVLPINTPVDYFPNGTDVVIIGCKTTAYFDAVMVILKTPKPVVYSRPDITRLTCPLPIP